MRTSIGCPIGGGRSCRPSPRGVLGDLNHAIDGVLWLFGEIASVTADARTLIGMRPDPETGAARVCDADDVVALVALLAGGAQVSVHLSRCTTGRRTPVR